MTESNQASTVDQLVQRLGERTGRLQTQLDFTSIQLEQAQDSLRAANERIQELEALVDQKGPHQEE